MNEKLTIFKEELNALHTRSQKQFKNIATEVLEDKKKMFVDENKNELNIILDPFKTNLTEFKEKVEFLRQHLRSVTDYINNLADKKYQSLTGLTTPDYVFMFMDNSYNHQFEFNEALSFIIHYYNRYIPIKCFSRFCYQDIVEVKLL